MIGPLQCIRIVFTPRERILVISEISIQQRQDPMSKECDLALEEVEEIEAALKDEQLLELAVHYNIQWRICSTAIKGQEESCVAKGKHACCSRRDRVVKV